MYYYEKTTVSPFKSTNINEKLKELKITDIIIAGQDTNACARVAAWHAAQRGYNVFTAPDLMTQGDALKYGFPSEYNNFDIYIAKDSMKLINMFKP